MILSTHCYIHREGQTLLMHRTKKKNDTMKGKWAGLGGKIESGETPEECIRREVKEESGLTMQGIQLKGFITFPNFQGSGDWYMFLFICREAEGKLLDSDEGELAWIDDDKIDELPMFEGDRLFMRWMKEEGFFTAKMCYEGDELVHYEVDRYSESRYQK